MKKEKKPKKNQEYTKATFDNVFKDYTIARRSRPDITFDIVAKVNTDFERSITYIQRRPSHIIKKITDEELQKRDFILITGHGIK